MLPALLPSAPPLSLNRQWSMVMLSVPALVSRPSWLPTKELFSSVRLPASTRTPAPLWPSSSGMRQLVKSKPMTVRSVSCCQNAFEVRRGHRCIHGHPTTDGNQRDLGVHYGKIIGVGAAVDDMTFPSLDASTADAMVSYPCPPPTVSTCAPAA